MTLSKRYDDDDLPACPKCEENALYRKRLRKQPLILQAIFAASFILFWFCTEMKWLNVIAVWIWTAFQIILGIWLAYARFKAKKMIILCAECGANFGQLVR